MKILILSDYFDNRGGAVGIAKSLAFGLKHSGHDVKIIASTQNKTNASIIPIMEANGESEIPIYYIHSKYNFFWRAYRSLYNPQTIKHIAKIIEETKPDIVHAHNIHTYLSYYALKIAKKSGAKVFLTAHDVMLFHYGKLTGVNYKISIWRQIKRAGKTYNPFRNIVIRRYLKYVDKIFAVSGALKDALNDNGIKNIEVVYNGIDVADWIVNDVVIQNFKEKYNIQNKKIILFGGRLGWLKGGREICLAMANVIKTVPNATLLLIGKVDGEVKEILNFAAGLGIGANIIAAGWLSGDELRAAYHVADVVATPSICFDSFPTMNLEAMACRKSVVATCFGGSREAIMDGETGYIVNPFNLGELSEKLAYLLENAEVADRFGEAGNERVKKEFNLKKMTENYLSWYGKN